MTDRKTLIVIGGGAAGFFCAVNAARLNPLLKVIILEKSAKFLAKVRVSGGGRCNVTHACYEISELIKKYPRGDQFIKKYFHWFNTADTVRWFEERGVRLKTEADGRMFPSSNSSQTIIDCLLREADLFGVETRLHSEVKKIETRNPAATGETIKKKFCVYLPGGNVDADFLSIACGGYPKAAMFEWITAMGHSIQEPVPSLFTFNLPRNGLTKLMGVSLADTKVKIEGTKLTEQGPVLITHWGLSGPAVLRLSAWGARILKEREYHFKLIINWLPVFNDQTMKEELQQWRQVAGAQKILHRNPFGLPQRLWEYFVSASGIAAETRWADLPSKEQTRLIHFLCSQEIEVNGKTTFKEEFVTAGGISLNEIDPNTMQSKLVPNLFFAGEVLNVDGITGGFNFQHAWTSGYISAKTIASLSL